MRIDTLIRNAQLLGSAGLVAVRLQGNRVTAIAGDLAPGAGDTVVDAAGGCLLPALHDHHIHLMATAAALDSEPCGPPRIQDAATLAARLRALDAEAPGSWLRGIGYHPCVAGDIDRDWLDRHIPNRPVRIQHRGGRLWVLNSSALETLAATGSTFPAGMEQVNGRPTGRLYEGDTWLRRQLPQRLPDIGAASRQLATYGVAGVTDTTPSNDPDTWERFRQWQASGALRQRVRMMGAASLGDCNDTAWLQRGELKVHLLESQLPDWGDTLTRVTRAHADGRGVAIHCVTLAELMFALGILEEAGVRAGDRIEHASVCPPEQLRQIGALGLRVITQPHFLAERGDQYLADVDAADQPWLYRAAGFLRTGVPLAGGSDAPFGSADPWQLMRAAVQRTTPAGTRLSPDEALTPEQAIGLYLSPPDTPGIGARSVAVGALADLCLLDCPWEVARTALDSRHVRATWIDGIRVYGSG